MIQPIMLLRKTWLVHIVQAANTLQPSRSVGQKPTFITTKQAIGLRINDVQRFLQAEVFALEVIHVVLFEEGERVKMQHSKNKIGELGHA